MTIVYIMLNPAFPFEAKIGITKNLRNRKTTISRSMDGFVFPAFIPLPFFWGARLAEKTLHLVFSFFRNPHRHGSGKSEWFYKVNVITGSAIYLWPDMLTCIAPPWVIYIVLVFYPIDIVIVFLALWLIDAGLITGILICVYKLSCI